MLVRDAGDDWLLITQGDHARLAAELAAAVAKPPVLPGRILWADVVEAIRRHDDGWFERDTQPVWDADRRRCRNFDEYALTEATAVWRDSVRRVQALSTQPAEWFDRRIDRRLYEWMWCALSTAAAPQTWPDLLARFDGQVGPPIPEQGLSEVLTAMCAAGSVLKQGAQFAMNPWHRPRASLATLWVSGHFDALAERSALRYRDDFVQSSSLRVFRADHRRRVEESETACKDLVSTDNLNILMQTGIHSVQFFDRLSLELCLQPSPFRQRIAVPGWPELDWGTDESNAIACESGLFKPDSTELAVTARRVSKSSGTSAEEWTAAYKVAEVESLRWTLASV